MSPLIATFSVSPLPFGTAATEPESVFSDIPLTIVHGAVLEADSDQLLLAT